jgi:hypothetical protein
MKYSRLSLIVLICTILIQLAMPYPVFADDATPPAPEATVEVLPVETEQPALEVTPVETEQPTEAIPTEAAPLAEANIMEGNQPDGILEALSDTNLVVLDENDQPIPLAMEAAADAISNSDPAWCPDGASFAAGTCANYATFSDLITGLHSIGGLTNGTVYVQEGDYLGPETSITLDGTYLHNVGNLTLIGGWDLTAASPSQTGTTVFGVPFSIINWTHDVSVQDIEIANAIGTGLTINTTGQASLENVIANNNTQDGIRIDAGNSITLNTVQANYNDDDGIDIRSDTNTGDITLKNIEASYNGDDGISIYSKEKRYISLQNIAANNNGGDGFELKSPQEVTSLCQYLENFIPAGETLSSTPEIEGPALVVYRTCSSQQELRILDAEFNQNDGNGMDISTSGDFKFGIDFESPITYPITANGNGKNGATVNFFASTLPSFFPWAYYKARAEALAGGPAMVYAYEFITEIDGYTASLQFNNNTEYGYIYTHELVSQCLWNDLESVGNGLGTDVIKVGDGTFICISPPYAIPILGGEQVLTGESENSETSTSVGGAENISGNGNEAESEGTPDNGSGTSLCAQNSIAILQLPSGNNLTVYCPISGTLSVDNLGKKKLPALLPDGVNFISGLDVTLSQGGVPIQVITESGHLKLSFVVPAEQAGKNLVILFWDASTNNWVELPAFGSEGSTSLPNNGIVSEGVQVLDNIGQIEVGVNFPGIFVLAVK